MPIIKATIGAIISQCVLCNNTSNHHSLICSYCYQDLPYFNVDILGYNLLAFPDINKKLPKFSADVLISIAPYQWPIATWISQLKYQQQTQLAPLLAYLLIQQWQGYCQQTIYNIDETIVIAVPLHINKWQKRGFNQAHLLAKPFADFFHYQYHPKLISRDKATLSQVGMSGVERRKNLKNAFTINSAFLNNSLKHAIIIDDVVTTGTTTNEICKLLKKQGIARVTVLSVCLA